MDYNVIAGNILKNVGGAQNVADVTHCFTRLRIVLKNKELANKEIVEKLEGVIQVVEANGQGLIRKSYFADDFKNFYSISSGNSCFGSD